MLIRPSTTANMSPRSSIKCLGEKGLDAQAIASKLAYEWKNIYRFLSSNESIPRGRGVVTSEVFDQALEYSNTRLTK